ncbi:TMEM175 family protein [Actinomadura sp. DC4]|uniref:TMEM175 family protein n=1 Tax=Actinomadura sp. DC4 TaxID=3055069 RepID=UPI0025AF0F8B|nr:TMEM175 family protein [Actinomadura sp. DC4]MDN3356702.1 TMEM175 family protein [Actinomadura sp. DC4]
MDGKRAEAFSDGVFAVAITLLVLELKVPGGEGTLLHRLLEIWPSYLAYAVSFLTVGIMWLNHHTMFAHIVRVTRPVLLLNLLLLMVVAMVPFPTAVIGEELGEHLRGDDAKTITVAYGLLMIVMSMCFSAVWWYVVFHPGMLDERLTPEDVRRSIPKFGFGLFGYVLATVMGLFSPLTSLVLLGVLGLYYAFEHLPTPRKLDPDPGAGTG